METSNSFLYTATTSPQVELRLPRPQSDEIKIYLDHEDFYFDGQILPLKQRPLTRRLLALFLKSIDFSCDQDELLNAIYGHQTTSNTDRYRSANRHNLVKLISRTRLLLKNRFNKSNTKNIRWFVFDADTDRWALWVESVKGPGQFPSMRRLLS